MNTETIFEIGQAALGNPFVRALIALGAIIVLQMIINAVLGTVVGHMVPKRKFKHKEDEKKREDTLTNIFRTLAAVVIWIVGGLIILVQLGVNIAALATGAGLLGIVIGFGAQKMIQDFLAGIFIIIENQYRVSDIVTLNAGGVDVTGVVEDISVRITRLRDLDGNLHIVQNGSAIIVTNLSIGFANVNVDVGVSYDSDIDKVESVINEVGENMAKSERWQEEILEPIVFLRVDSFGASSVNIKALGKVRPGMQWEVAGEFRRRLVKAFEKNGIEIPFQQIVLHQVGEKSGRHDAKK